MGQTDSSLPSQETNTTMAEAAPAPVPTQAPVEKPAPVETKAAVPEGCCQKFILNTDIEKEKACCMQTMDIEEIAEKGKVAICRCWKSKKFPYCDGAHKAHNAETGDNLGPMIIKKTVPQGGS